MDKVWENWNIEEEFDSDNRLVVGLCLDVSKSMTGEPIIELQRGVEMLYNDVKNDSRTSHICEFGGVTFGGDIKNIWDEFIPVENQYNNINFTADGMTPMGEAVNIVLDSIEKRIETFKGKGISYYKPWLVLFTDGKNNGAKDEYERAISRTNDLLKQKRLVLFAVGLGKDADFKELGRFCLSEDLNNADSEMVRNSNLIVLKNIESLSTFFSFLTSSVAMASESGIGSVMDLDNIPWKIEL